MRLIKFFLISFITLECLNLQAQTYDSDAQKFFTATGITNTTQKTAINNLVVSLKNASLWAKMKAIYPFVGGITFTPHSYNLRDTGTFRLLFNGVWSYSSTGALPDGSTAFANTQLVPSTVFSSANDISFGCYLRTNFTSSSNYDMGALSNSPTANAFLTSRTSDLFYAVIGDGSSFPNFTNTDSRGFFTANRTSGVLRGGKNGTEVINSSLSAILPTVNMYLGALNSNGNEGGFSNREFAFAYIGYGLDHVQDSTLNRIVHNYQCTLSRSVDSCTGGGGILPDSTSSGSDSNWVRSGNNIYNNNSGNVGIGITNPPEKLSVNGNISAKKLIVTQSGWADFVFDKNYKLPTINETEKFINLNKHLPGIPSAKEVEKNGLDLGTNQALLLKKIEELTLLLINQNKKLEKQNFRIKSLENKLMHSAK